MAVVDLINSQSLNQYALLNNPIDYVNPDAPDLLLKNRSDPRVVGYFKVAHYRPERW